MTEKHRRRKKQPAAPYDYEQAYSLAVKNLEEADARRAAMCGIRYAAKEIRAGGQLEVEIYPEFARGKNPYTPTAAQREQQRRAQKNLNERNSRKQCERILNANFGDGDIWATLTYSPDNMPADMDEALKNMQRYIRRVNYQRKKRGLPNARYVYITEGNEDHWHHHVIMDGDLDLDTVENLWTKGRRNNTRRISTDADGLAGMAKYITKEKKAKKSQKRWTPSKGLKKPKESVNHYKFRRKDVRDMAQDENCIGDKMRKWYEEKGYVFREAECRTNAVNGGIYIYARLYRAEKPKARMPARRTARKKE